MPLKLKVTLLAFNFGSGWVPVGIGTWIMQFH